MVSKQTMRTRTDIPIRIESCNPRPAAATDAAFSPVRAVLTEIETLLQRFHGTGDAGSIDLRCLAQSPDEMAALRGVLGEGEVRADIRFLGSSIAEETAIPCVWWVTHRDNDDRVVAELLEINELPDIVRSDRAFVPQAIESLRQRQAVLGALAVSTNRSCSA